MTYKFLEHTADIKIQASGKSIEEAFESSAFALREVIFKHEKIIISDEVRRKISVAGKDKEALLYNFLEEFLYLLDARNFLLSKIVKIKIKGDKLEAEVLGDRASNYNFSNEVKAITYNEMFVKEKKGKTSIQFVLDV